MYITKDAPLKYTAFQNARS